jgi:hypothetical protein
MKIEGYKSNKASTSWNTYDNKYTGLPILAEAEVKFIPVNKSVDDKQFAKWWDFSVQLHSNMARYFMRKDDPENFQHLVEAGVVSQVDLDFDFQRFPDELSQYTNI